MKKKPLIYSGALLTILGVTIFQDSSVLLFSSLILGVVLVLIGLRQKEEKNKN